MKYLFFAIILLQLFAGCQTPAPEVTFTEVEEYLVEKLEVTAEQLNLMAASPSTEKAREHFVAARQAFKAAEPFAEYFSAENVHKVNGPPLPIFLEDNGRVLEPVSLQAIDEQLYSEERPDSALLARRADMLNGYLMQLRKTIADRGLTPQRFFVPVHQQFMRIYALSTISFDTPASLKGLDDAIISLESIREVYMLSIADTVLFLNEPLHKRFLSELDHAVRFISENNEFETFDRYTFGREYLNPLTRSWVEIRQTTGLFEDPKVYALNLDAPTLFEKISFNVVNFRSSTNKKPSEGQIDLGRELFFDERLSSSGNLSCASCHDPENAYQDGLVTGRDKNGKPLKRNTPTLINSIFQKKFFWDGRSDNLEQQISAVFENESEFDHAGHTISLDILDDPEYVEKLKKLFSKETPARNEVVKALSAYTSTLYSFDSRFDRNMRGETSDFTAQEIKGMNLFMGKAVCATCHFIPLTNGTVPPGFMETEKEILGTPETSENLEVDDDPGFYWVYREDIHKYMFKTPTIRNIQHTGPYMHNGVYGTLEEVMDFYNQGGGGGMGFALEHQTLPFDSLNLNEEEIAAIIAFMKTFSDLSVDSRYTPNKDEIASNETTGFQ